MQDNFRSEYLGLDQQQRADRMRRYWRHLAFGVRVRMYRGCGYGWIRAVVYSVL